MKRRTIFTPATVGDFSRESRLAYWKQILPEGVVNYKDKLGRKRSVNFDDVYLSKLLDSFSQGKVNQTAFQLAGANNEHNMLPERTRGLVTEMRLAEGDEKPGLYGKVEFPSRADAKAVIRNPGLGVSARIREDDDGPVIVHVLGTLDPQVTGMESWKPVDLSQISGKVLDLSNESFTEGSNDMAQNVAIKDREASSFTEAEIEGFTEAQLDEYLEAFAVDENGEPFDFDDEAEDDDAEDDSLEDEDDDDDDDEGEAEDAVNDLSTRGQNRDIELANARAASADARASSASPGRTDSLGLLPAHRDWAWCPGPSSRSGRAGSQPRRRHGD